jgi:hypothetical protein
LTGLVFFSQRINSVLASTKAVAAAFAITLVLAFHGSVAAQPSTTFVFVKVMDRVMPVEPGSKCEDPWDEALKQAKLGEVTGGGTSLTKEKTIDWVGLDVELTDVMRGIPFLKKKLIELGAPRGSILEYQFGGQKVKEPVHD